MILLEIYSIKSWTVGAKMTEEYPLPKREFVNCFACSPVNEKGLKLEFWYTTESCISYYTIPPEYCGFEGLAHGGVIATILDEVAAWTVITQLSKIGVTTQATIRYLKPIPTGNEIKIVGRIREKTEHKAKVFTKITEKSEEILAESESTWFLPDLPTLEKITGVNATAIKTMVARTLEPINALKRILDKIGQWVPPTQEG
ncbi:MAG: PaaI family thioesterase [Candidatus Heimdallarchaeota archaeon]|nr:PaaI family thioesterase [Candidatus Heimdallarchaeota archaeon]